MWHYAAQVLSKRGIFKIQKGNFGEKLPPSGEFEKKIKLATLKGSGSK